MQRTAFGDMTCSIARTLDIAGEPWTPLILRDLFVGIRRFVDLQRDLGISRKVLTQRLNHLLDHGIVERRPYTDKPVRYDYLLTEKAGNSATSSSQSPPGATAGQPTNTGRRSSSTTRPAGTPHTRSSPVRPGTSRSGHETFTSPPGQGHHRRPSHPPKQLPSQDGRYWGSNQ